jgi:hypothetical protein
MTKIHPTGFAEATDRWLATDGLFARDSDDDEEDEEEQEDEEEDSEDESEDESDGYSE